MIEIDIHLPRRNFDLKIQEQFGPGITGIFGPSGAGKTSLLQSIAGLAKPSQGRIQVGGRILFDSAQKINLPVEKRNIAYVFQDGRLFPHLNVEGNLKYGLNKKKEAPVSFKELVDLLQLGHLLKSKPAQISGGERQRTALGRSLLSSPDLLLLDEPFSAVDMQLRQHILHFILKVQQKTNLPTLVVSHDLPDLLKLSKKLCIIKEGTCLAHSDYHDLLKDQQAAQLLGTSPLINTIAVKIKTLSHERSLMHLIWEKNEQEIILKCEQKQGKYEVGNQLKLIIQADDIALSRQKLTQVSIQNQLLGRVQELIPRETHLLCQVDVGFPLVVQISREAQLDLEIEIGTEVWCLFKSAGIEVLG